MLNLNILPMCKARLIEKPYTFLMHQGFTHAVAQKLASGRYPQPKLAYLETICIALGCTPNDILEWRPGKGQRGDIPLAALAPKEDTGLDWMKDIQNLQLPIEQLRAIGAMVKDALPKKQG